MPLLVSAARRHAAASVAWTPAATAGALSTAMVAVDARTTILQAASFLIGTAVAFAVDDPAHSTLAASPRSLLRRRMDRIGGVVVAGAAAWAALVLTFASTTRPELAALVAIFIGLIALGLGIGGVAARENGRGGLAAAPGVLALILASSIVPTRWRPLPLGDVPGGFAAIVVRWTSAAVIGGAVFLWSSRDPARRWRAGRT